MKIWLGVSNFAKIESACICINQFTLLVGQNNSGKTFLMQLAQEVAGQLASLADDGMADSLLVERTEEYDCFEVSAENILPFTELLNKKLKAEKDTIVRETFGKEIPVEDLYVHITMEDEIEDGIAYRFYIIDAEKDYFKYGKEIFDSSVNLILSKIQSLIGKRKICLLNKINQKQGTFVTVNISLVSSENKLNLFQKTLNKILCGESLFLPASRTGLLLLYRDFFVNRADSAISYEMKNGNYLNGNQAYGGLTKPAYEFLRFLQTYSEDNILGNEYGEELKFFEEHLIEGQISFHRQNTFYYQSHADGDMVPMYLVSSMINEIAPIAMALKGGGFQLLIIDEVEASLHPEKQLELVRFLNRLNNKGMAFIVSTHSDTFVSRMNNLYILSEYFNKEQNKEILDKFSLEANDLIKSQNLFVYEFMLQPNGKSIVKEIQGDAKSGYQFDLFTKPALKLYDEASLLGEMHG